MNSIQIDVTDRQDQLAFDPEQLGRAIRVSLQLTGIHKAEISLAILDNAQIHALNRQFLQHDYPTDVLSFCWEPTADGTLQGEIIASAEMAQQVAPEYGWSASDELTLYVIHGALHLTGMDDATEAERAEMREQEDKVLEQLGIRRGNSSSADERECTT